MIPNGPGYGHARSFADTSLFAIANICACVTAAIVAAACWISWTVTFTPLAEHLPSALFVPFFALIFPLFGWSVWLQSVARRPPGVRRASGNWMKVIPPGGRILVALAAAAATVGGSTAAGTLSGQPEYDPATHRYFLDDHGRQIPVGRAVYLHALAVQNRLFLGVTLIFVTVALVITYGDWSRHRPEGSLLRRWPRPVRPRPKIPFPVPALVVTAIAALAATTAGGVLIIDRVGAWSNHAIYLRVGHPVAAKLAPGHYTVFAGCTQDMNCAHLDPGSVAIRSASYKIDVVPDPSSDHDSEGSDGQPFLGELSLSIPRAVAVQIELVASPGQPVFVVPSEGQEARALTGWIMLTGSGLLILLLSLVGLGRLAWWRLTPEFRAGSFQVDSDMTGRSGHAGLQ